MSIEAIALPTLSGVQIEISQGTPPFEIYYLGKTLIYKGSVPLYLHPFDKSYNTSDLFYLVKDADDSELQIELGDPPLDRYETGFMLEILRRENLILDVKGGFPIKIYKRRKPAIEGPCPNCRSGLDDFLPPGTDIGSEITECEYCFGTGIKGGYYPPINSKANYYNIQDQRFDLLEPVRLTNYTFYILNYPLIEKEDLIFSEALGKMFRITAVSPFTYKGLPVKQIFVASEIGSGHPAYRLSREVPLVITDSATATDAASTQ